MRHMEQLNLQLLGAFEARWHNQLITNFPSDKIRALFAYLAVESPRPQRRETLATLLWSDWPDDSARRNLRQNLHRLKQLLDSLETGLSQQLLQVTRPTILIDLDYLVLDVNEIDQALRVVEAHAHRHIHQCAACLDRLAQVAERFHGEFLQGFSLPDAPLFDEWLALQRERLHYQQLQVLQTLTQAFLQREAYEQAYLYAAQQVVLEPWREEAHRQMMVALARQGRRSEALAQYATCCRLLDEELGIAPTQATTDLYAQLVDDGIALHEGEGKTAVSAQLHHFPTYFTPFLGREAEVEAVVNQLQNRECRLLTLLAPGGMGKTRLSIAAATELAATSDQHADGLYFVSLAEVHDPETLLITIAQTVEMSLQEVVDIEASLHDFLAGKQLLLVLDNFEQLMEGVDLLVALLTAVPGLQLLVTSRIPLDVQAEWRFAVQGLDFPVEDDDPDWERYTAVQLFSKGARRINPHFDVEAQQAAISRICQLVQGMPLAIEMAAAWTRVMPCVQIGEQIASDIEFLVATGKDVPERHRSIQAVFAQSWHLLTTAEQRVCAQLALFHHGFSYEAAAFVASASILDLTSLVDKSLLRYTVNGRYEMHPLLHQFMAGKLQTLCQTDTAVATCGQRYATFYLTQLRTHETQFYNRNSMAIANALQPDLDNIRQAWTQAISDEDVDLLVASQDGLINFFRWLGLHQEAVELLTQAAQAIGRCEDVESVVALLNYRMAKLHLDLTWYDTAVQLLEDAYAVVQEQGTDSDISRLLAALGVGYWRLGELDLARTHLQKGLHLAKQLNDAEATAYALHHLGNVTFFYGDRAAALQMVNQSLPFYREEGDLWQLAGALTDLGAFYAVDNLEKSRHYFAESLDLYRQLGDRLGMLIPLNNLGYVALLTQDYELAYQMANEGYVIAKKIGADAHRAGHLQNLGLSTLLSGGDLTKAKAYFQEGFLLACKRNALKHMGEALMGLVITAVKLQNYQMAARLVGSIEALCQLQLEEMSSIEMSLYQPARETAVHELGSDTFAELRQKGTSLQMKDVVRLVQGEFVI